jgi:hypothetical protein
MSDATFEAALAGQLRQYAEAGVRPIDGFAIAEATIAAGARQPRLAFVFGGRAAALALLALLLLAMVGALLLLAIGRQPAPLVGPGYAAIVLRPNADAPDADIDVIAVQPDGQERVVRRLSAALLPDDRVLETFGSVSQDGWVAVGTHVGPDDSPAWALVDLIDPARTPRLVPYQPVIGGAWGPNGLFATTEPGVTDGFRITVVEAGTGVTTSLGPLNLPGGGPDIIWAADGSGVVVRVDEGSDQNTFAIARVDGGSSEPGVPRLAPRLMNRYIAPGGTALQLPIRTVQTRDAQGNAIDWYADELAPASLLDASFSADGRSIWMLFDRLDGPSHVAVIARASAPRDVQVVRTVELGSGVSTMWFSGLAPDDSSIAIGYGTREPGGETAIGPTRVVRMSGRTPVALVGNLIGFVPESIP